MVNSVKPDERSVMAYVSSYYHAFSGAQQVWLVQFAFKKPAAHTKFENNLLWFYVYSANCFLSIKPDFDDVLQKLNIQICVTKVLKFRALQIITENRRFEVIIWRSRDGISGHNHPKMQYLFRFYHGLGIFCGKTTEYRQIHSITRYVVLEEE